jgi:hypothetical protein
MPSVSARSLSDEDIYVTQTCAQMLVGVLLALSVTVLLNFSLGAAACIVFVPVYLLITTVPKGSVQVRSPSQPSRISF